ncbi:hypothetical protein Hanom_Chr12g01127121 [Helianthus anomalus]
MAMSARGLHGADRRVGAELCRKNKQHLKETFTSSINSHLIICILHRLSNLKFV